MHTKHLWGIPDIGGQLVVNSALEEGIRLCKENEFAKSIEKLQPIVKFDPTNVNAHLYLAVAYGQMRQFEEAVIEFLALTRLEPNNSNHFYNLGKAYEGNGNDLQAAAAYQKALDIQPNYQKAKDSLLLIEAKKQDIAGTQLTPSEQPNQFNQPAYPFAQYPPQQTPPNYPYGVPPPLYQNNMPLQNIQYAMPDWFVVLLLLLITPVGIIFMWWKSRWNSGVKWGITSVWAVLIFLSFGFFYNVSRSVGMNEHEKARQNVCASHLKMISNAMMAYVQDYDETFPPSERWNDVLMPYVNGESVYQCPSALEQKCGYAYNVSLSSLSFAVLESPANMEADFDALADWNTSGGWDLAAYRHRNGLDVSYADGHVKWSALPER